VKTDDYGRVSITETEAFTALYQGKIHDLQGMFVHDVDAVNQYNQSCDTNADRMHRLDMLPDIMISQREFDLTNQAHWFMPDSYREFPLVEWLYNQCTTDQQHARVSEELELFVQHGMYDLLVYLKYLVDTMRSHGIVWGVGRGSSVASYCLYLMGVHKVDSIRYKLDIKEFLK
jgi:DNA polymerase III alpha subunit